MLTVNQAISQGLVSVILDPTGVLSLHGENGYHISNDSPAVIESTATVTHHVNGFVRATIADAGQLHARMRATRNNVDFLKTITATGVVDGCVYSAGLFDKAFSESVTFLYPAYAGREMTKSDNTTIHVKCRDPVPVGVYMDFHWGSSNWNDGSGIAYGGDFIENDMPGVDIAIQVPDAYAPVNGDGRVITVAQYSTQAQITAGADYAGPMNVTAGAMPINQVEVQIDVDISAAVSYHDVGSGVLDDTWKYDIHRSQLATLQAYASDLYAYRNGETVDPVTGDPVFVDSTMSGITVDTVIAGRTADQWSLDEIVSLQSFCIVEGLRQIADASYVNNTIDNVINTLHCAVDDFVNLASATVDSVDQIYTQKAFLTHVIQDIETSYSTVTPIDSMDVSQVSADSEYINYQAMRDVNSAVCDTGSLVHESQRRGVYNAVGAYVMSMGEIAGTSSAASTVDTGIGASMIASPVLSVQFKHQSDHILPFTELYSPTIDGRTARCVLALSQVDLDVYRVDMYARHFGGDDSDVAASISAACRDLAAVARGMGCTGDWSTPGGDFSAFRGWITAAAGSIQAALSTLGLSACMMLPVGNQAEKSSNQVLSSSEYRALTPADIRAHSDNGDALDVRVDRVRASDGSIVRYPVDPVDRKGKRWSTLKASIVRHAGVLTGALGVASLGTALVSAGLSSGSIANASWNITGDAITRGFAMSAPSNVVDQYVPFADPKAMIAWVAKCMLEPSQDSRKPKLCLETMPMGCYLFAEQRPSAVTSVANALTTAALASWCIYLRKYRTYTVARSPIVSPFAGAALPASAVYGLVKATHNALSDEPVTNAQLATVLRSYLGTPQEYSAFNVGLAVSTELSSKAASALNGAFSDPTSETSWDDVREKLRAVLDDINRLARDERTYYL